MSGKQHEEEIVAIEQAMMEEQTRMEQGMDAETADSMPNQENEMVAVEQVMSEFAMSIPEGAIGSPLSEGGAMGMVDPGTLEPEPNEDLLPRIKIALRKLSDLLQNRDAAPAFLARLEALLAEEADI